MYPREKTHIGSKSVCYNAEVPRREQKVGDLPFEGPKLRTICGSNLDVGLPIFTAWVLEHFCLCVNKEIYNYM